MSDSNRPPALPSPSPGGGGDQSGVATPGTTRTTPRTFQPQRVATFRRDGISQTDAMAEIARRRTAQPSARDVQGGRVPRQPPAARAPDAPVDDRSFSPLQTGAAPPQPQPEPHPLAPGPQLPNDPVFDLTIGGQPARVALSELVRGYMRHQDYTSKTQQNAALLKTAQDAHVAFDNARKALEARLPAVIASFGDEFAQPIDWVKLSREDPIGYTQKDARFKAYMAAQQEQANLATLRANEQQLKKEEMKRLGHAFLSDVLPGWRDEATRKELQKAQVQHLRQVGYTDAEIEQYEMLDPRQVVLLEESRRFRAIVAAHPELLRPQSDALRPQPTPQRETGANGRQPRLPQTQVAAGEAERVWQELPERSGARAREAAIDLIGARRRAGGLRDSRS